MVSSRACRAGARVARLLSRPHTNPTAPSVTINLPFVRCRAEGSGHHNWTKQPHRDALQKPRTFASSTVSQAANSNVNPPHAPLHGFDAHRAGLSDLTDVFHPEPLDMMTGGNRSMQFIQPGYLSDFGGITKFAGPASTIKCFENNPLVREALNEPGNGRVLVVDGGGSKRCALLGDNLAELAFKNNWAGVVINGCLRDAEDTKKIKIGVKAIGTPSWALRPHRRVPPRAARHDDWR